MMPNDLKTTRPFWRSMDELVGTPQFRDWASAEFSPEAMEAPTGMNRREWMKLAAASFVMMTLASCSRAPEQEIVPHVHAPQGRTPQKPQFFATTLTRGREAIGVIVTSQEGRPTKIEGNPKHPASLGATDIYAQAEVLALCDPDRSQSIQFQNRIATWDKFRKLLVERAENSKSFRLLTGPIISPSMLDQISQLLKKYPSMQWHVYDPTADVAATAAHKAVFGQDVQPSYDLAAAKIVVSFDADLFFGMPGSVRYARDYANGRRVREGATADSMNRLYVAEPSPTITGGKADHRRIAKPSDLPVWVESLAAKLGIAGATDNGANDGWLNAAAADLKANPGKSLVVAGSSASADTQDWILRINAALGNIGKTVTFRAISSPAYSDFQSLIADANAGKVDSLLIVDSNVVYTTPSFADTLKKIDYTVYLGLYEDETGHACSWHVPMTHALESWGDAIAYDGTVSPVQPLIAPLYDGKSPRELLAVMLGDPLSTEYEIVSAYWQKTIGGNFSAWWQGTFRDGVAPASGNAPATLQPKLAAKSPATPTTFATGLQAVYRMSNSSFDGRYANNAWLQELPDPITKLTWDNAAWLSPATANKLGVTSGEVCTFTNDGGVAKAPVFVVPGHAEDSVTLPLGYGRTRAGSIGNIGFNAYGLRSAKAPNSVILAKTGETYALSTTQEHSSMEDREPIKTMPVADFGKPSSEKKTIPLSLYPDRLHAPQQWGMSIDLTSCIGCNACAIACQAENNIPIVGKEEISRGREMAWIRIDRYFSGEDESDPEIHHQPVPCMQCENAPCETVCPVGATQHSEDGLNDMVYNRCIGTRYCSNNCPYKVRRFNFFQYTDLEHESLQIQRNPQVTVRSRGVMEKCTYCVQRIRNAQIVTDIDPANAGKSIPEFVADGVIQTACQQVCPTQAIIFGDKNDPKSAVSFLKSQSHDYSLLEDLNTRPRTTYLAEVKNPHPALAKGARA